MSAQAAAGAGGGAPPLDPKDERLYVGTSKFEDWHTIYSASRSSVWRCTHILTGRKCAVKAYKLALLTPDEERQVRKELRVARAVDEHPCVLRPIVAFEEGPALYLVQDYADQGDLFEVLSKFVDSKMPEQFAAQVMLQVTMAICACHESGVIHRDIKPENVVMDDDGVCYLMDFGLAINARKHRPLSRVGTLEYLAPEVLSLPGERVQRQRARDRPGGYYNESVDVWALGVLAYELLSGRSPFAAESDVAVEDAILGMTGAPAGLQASTAARNFVSACLKPAAGDRPSAHALLEMPWLVSAVEFIDYCPMLLGCTPQRRRSSLDGGDNAAGPAARLRAAAKRHEAWAQRRRLLAGGDADGGAAPGGAPPPRSLIAGSIAIAAPRMAPPRRALAEAIARASDSESDWDGLRAAADSDADSTASASDAERDAVARNSSTSASSAGIARLSSSASVPRLCSSSRPVSAEVDARPPAAAAPVAPPPQQAPPPQLQPKRTIPLSGLHAARGPPPPGLASAAEFNLQRRLERQRRVARAGSSSMTVDVSVLGTSPVATPQLLSQHIARRLQRGGGGVASLAAQLGGASIGAAGPMLAQSAAVQAHRRFRLAHARGGAGGLGASASLRAGGSSGGAGPPMRRASASSSEAASHDGSSDGNSEAEGGDGPPHVMSRRNSRNSTPNLMVPQ